MNDFYDELFRHWRPRVPGPVPLVNLDDEDEDPGEVDLSEFYEVKDEMVEDPPMEMDPYYATSLWTEDDQEGGPGKGEFAEGNDEPGKGEPQGGELAETKVEGDEPGKGEPPQGGELAETKVEGDEPGKREGKAERDEPREEVVEAKVEGAVGEVGKKLETPSPCDPLVPGSPCQPCLKPSFVPEKMSSSDIEARIAKLKHLVSTL